MKSSTFPPKKTVLAFAILALLLSLLAAYTSYLAAVAKATFSNSDQANIGIMVLRLSDPSLFQRDYVFQETHLFEFYTPAFLEVVRFLTQVTGTYDLALTAMVPFMLFFYLLGMFLLLFQITQNSLVSALVSLISSSHKVAIAGTFWGVVGIGAMMPRSVVLTLVPWLLLLWFTWLEDTVWWKLPIAAFFIGLVANLHPVSGFVLLQLLLAILLLTYGFSRAGLLRFGASSLAALIGVWPTLTNFLQNSGPEVTGQETAVTFTTFYNILHERLVTLFPFMPENLNFFGHPLTGQEQTAVIWIYLALMLLIGLTALLANRGIIRQISGRAFFAILFIVQLPVAYLLMRFSEPGLIVFAALYLLFVVSEGPDKWDWRFLAWIILVICLGFIAAYFLDIIWKQFELWSLTSLVGEQARIARFIYLPFYIILARFLTALDKNLVAGWAKTGAIITLGLMIWLPDIQMALVVAAFCLTILVQLRYPNTLQSRPWLSLVLEVIALSLALNLLFSILEIGQRSVLLFMGAYLLLRFYYWRGRSQTARNTAVVIILVGLFFVGFGLVTAVNDLESAPEQIQARLEPTPSDGMQDDLALYDWAQKETERDSLFYYDSLDFRFRAERSITHSWKDLGIAYYSRSLLVPFYERFFTLQEAYEDPDRLYEMANAYQVDYIVVDTRFYPHMTLNIPIVFENDSFVVYRLN